MTLTWRMWVPWCCSNMSSASGVVVSLDLFVPAKEKNVFIFFMFLWKKSSEILWARIKRKKYDFLWAEKIARSRAREKILGAGFFVLYFRWQLHLIERREKDTMGWILDRRLIDSSRADEFTHPLFRSFSYIHSIWITHRARESLLLRGSINPFHLFSPLSI